MTVGSTIVTDTPLTSEEIEELTSDGNTGDDDLYEECGKDPDLPCLEIKLKLSNILLESERKTYTIFTMLGDIGGFNTAINILPTFILAQYSGRMYSSSIKKEIPVRKTKKRRPGQSLSPAQQRMQSGVPTNGAKLSSVDV